MNISSSETTEANAYSNATNAIGGSSDVMVQRSTFDGAPLEESLPPRMLAEDSSIHKLGRSSPTMGIAIANIGAINKNKGCDDKKNGQ